MTERAVDLLVILGPTGSGKSDLAKLIAQDYNGEIIAADSRTIYRGLDIGTAKPTRENLHEIAHWGLDLVEPNQRYTAYDYQQYALKKIKDIRKRGKLPILVGGTGLYIDAVLHNYSFAPVNHGLRVKLEAMTLNELMIYCKKYNIKLPVNYKNRRHVIGSILRNDSNIVMTKSLRPNTIVVGIDVDRSVLRNTLEQRIVLMLEQGVVKEATDIAERYSWDCYGLSGNIYPLIRSYIQSDLSKEEFVQKAIVKDMQLAKRQMTWFRRHDYIVWQNKDNIYSYVKSVLDQIK